MSFSQALATLASRAKDFELFISEAGVSRPEGLWDASNNSSSASPSPAAQNQSAALTLANDTNASAIGGADQRRGESIRRGERGLRRVARDVVLAVTCGQGHAPQGRFCASCAVGKYKEEKDNSSCSECPLHAITARQGSVFPAHCVCKDMFINIQNVSSRADGNATQSTGAGLREAENSGGDLALMPTCKPKGYVEPDRIKAASNAISISVALAVGVQVYSARASPTHAHPSQQQLSLAGTEGKEGGSA